MDNAVDFTHRNIVRALATILVPILARLDNTLAYGGCARAHTHTDTHNVQLQTAFAREPEFTATKRKHEVHCCPRHSLIVTLEHEVLETRVIHGLPLRRCSFSAATETHGKTDTLRVKERQQEAEGSSQPETGQRC